MTNQRFLRRQILKSLGLGGLALGTSSLLPVYSVYKGYYQSSGQGFRAGLERVVVFHVAGVPGTVCSGGVAGFKGVDEGGKGSYTVGGMILERSFRRLGGGIRRCCLNSSGGEVEALLRRGSRWLKNRGDSPIS